MFAYTCFDTHISLKYVRHEEGTLRAEAVEAGRSKPDVRPEASAQRDVVNRITWIFQGLATWERYLQRRLLLFSPLVSQPSSRLSCIIPIDAEWSCNYFSNGPEIENTSILASCRCSSRSRWPGKTREPGTRGGWNEGSIIVAETNKFRQITGRLLQVLPWSQKRQPISRWTITNGILSPFVPHSISHDFFIFIYMYISHFYHPLRPPKSSIFLGYFIFNCQDRPVSPHFSRRRSGRAHTDALFRRSLPTSSRHAPTVDFGSGIDPSSIRRWSPSSPIAPITASLYWLICSLMSIAFNLKTMCVFLGSPPLSQHVFSIWFFLPFLVFFFLFFSSSFSTLVFQLGFRFS